MRMPWEYSVLCPVLIVILAVARIWLAMRGRR